MSKRADRAGREGLCLFTLLLLVLGSVPAGAAPAPGDTGNRPAPAPGTLIPGTPAPGTPPAPTARRPADRPRASSPRSKARTAAPRAVHPAERDAEDQPPPRADTPYSDKDADEEGRAKEKPHTVTTRVRTELSAGVLYDDNAALGRRGQFGADQVYDVTSIFGVDSRLQTDIRKRLRFVLTGKLRAEEGRWRQFLRNTEVSAKPAFEIDLGDNMTLTPSINFKLHRETEEVWGYLEAAPSLSYILYTKLGLIFEASYDFKATYYDSDEPTNTYANVDRLSHLLKLRFKVWQTPKIRWSVKLEAEHQTFDDNIEERLAKIMFVPIDEFTDPTAVPVPIKRRDLFLRAELEFLMLPRADFGFAVGYRFEWDNSNLDAFHSVAHGPRVALIFSKGIHQVYGEARVSFYDFYDFRFDTRFSDTRRDIKLEGFATYQVTIQEVLKLGAKITFLSNFSNDSQKDPNGVLWFDSRNSRSYSRYQGTRIELMVTYIWDTQKGAAPPAPKPEPRLPGTIMASR